MSGLEQEFPGEVVAENVDATLPESEMVIRELGFANHGLVVRSPEGQVVLKQADHTVDVDALRERLRELVAQE